MANRMTAHVHFCPECNEYKQCEMDCDTLDWLDEMPIYQPSPCDDCAGNKFEVDPIDIHRRALERTVGTSNFGWFQIHDPELNLGGVMTKEDVTAIRQEHGKENPDEYIDRVRCFQIEFTGNQERFAKSPDMAFLELNQFFVEHDADGPFLGVITEKGCYKIRLEKV